MRLRLLVIAEHGLKREGLIERGHDWYVQWVKVDTATLNTAEFNGVMANWKGKVEKRASEAQSAKNYTRKEVSY